MAVNALHKSYSKIAIVNQFQMSKEPAYLAVLSAMPT